MSEEVHSVMRALRECFLERLFMELVHVHDGVPNFADKSSPASSELSAGLLQNLGHATAAKKPSPQTIGSRFERLVAEYLELAFVKLAHLRPGAWDWSVSQARVGIAKYDQFEHLAHIQRLVETHPELQAAIGADYLITPDIMVGRFPCSDTQVNELENLVSFGDGIASRSPLRMHASDAPPILHATISCKWTIRSDRAQNSRAEALNLIRNRKGGSPRIMFVTMEPLPRRLASIALGTGDIDCTYHVALNELLETARECALDDHRDQLQELVDGRRLRDISDLPFDLAI